MQRFILQQNVNRFKQMLAEKNLDERSRPMVQALLISAQRDLAVIDSEKTGAYGGVMHAARARHFSGQYPPDTPQFEAHFKTAREPYMLLDPGPGLRIVDINLAYAAVTMVEREAVVGRGLFDVFPDNPEDSSADGVNNLFTSLRIVAETGEANTMPVQRYDVRNGDGVFVERHWQPINTPIFDEDGHLRYILHYVEDVTDQATAERRADRA
ncbi:MAG: PAS domain-containing protein [Methylovirgula sp.]|jgi:PAS domain-containing protein